MAHFYTQIEFLWHKFNAALAILWREFGGLWRKYADFWRNQEPCVCNADDDNDINNVCNADNSDNEINNVCNVDNYINDVCNADNDSDINDVCNADNDDIINDYVMLIMMMIT